MSGLTLSWTIPVPLNATTANTARDGRGNQVLTCRTKPVGDAVVFLVGRQTSSFMQTVFPKERCSNALVLTSLKRSHRLQFVATATSSVSSLPSRPPAARFPLTPRFGFP